MRGLQGRWGQSVQIVSIRFSLTGTRSWPALLKALDILFHWSAKGKESRAMAVKNAHWFNNSPIHRGHTQESESPPFLPASPSSHFLKKQSKSYYNYSSTNTATTASSRYRTSQPWSLMLELKNCSSRETEVTRRSHPRGCRKGVLYPSAVPC